MPNVQAIKALPKEIRSWFASETATDEIRNVNDRFGLTEDERRFVPYLLSLLITKELPPQDFIEELGRWLDVTPSSASGVATEIKDRVLKPVGSELRSWGVEINLIKPTESDSRLRIVAPSPPPSPAHSPEMDSSSTPKTETHPMKPEPVPSAPSPSSVTPPKPQEVLPPEPTPAEEPKAKGEVKVIGEAHELNEETPFMLHKENAFSPVGEKQEYFMPQKSESFPPSYDPWKKSRGAPKEPQRVVHYDENTAPAPQKKSAGNKGDETEKTAEEKKIKLPINPNLAGNTIDLREE